MRDEDQAVKNGQRDDESRIEAEPVAEMELEIPRGNEWAVGGGKRAETVRVIAGDDDPHGREAHNGPPGDYPAFDPRYVCVLFIDFRSDWTLSINHASYEFQPGENPQAERLAKAIAVIDGKIRSGRDLAQVPGHLPYAWRYPALHQQGRTHDSTTFADFKFKSPTEIFIFLNRTSFVLGPNPRLIRFTRYGSLGTSGGVMSENYSFFRAREVTGAELGVLNGQGKLIRLENHARVNPTTSTDVQPQFYSMNIRLGINGNAAGVIPVIIDPDTGNGQGNEP